MFGRWGRFVYRHRLATLIGSGAVLVASVVFLIMGGTLTRLLEARTPARA